MDKKRKRFFAVAQCLGLLGFALAAMASSSAQDTINSKEFRDGFRDGWDIGTEIGRRLGSDAAPEIQRLDIDSVSYNQPCVATID